MKPMRGTTLTLVLVSLLCAALAFLGTIRENTRHVQHVWPLHTPFLLPEFLMAAAWIALGLALVFVVIWLILGEKE